MSYRKPLSSQKASKKKSQNLSGFSFSNEILGLSEILYLDQVSKADLRHFAAPVSLALGLSLSAMPFAYAGPGDTNSTNYGQTVYGGVYYNTAGSHTTFQSTSSAGLWVHQGDTVRGLEVNGHGQVDGNGGNLVFNAPGGVVRVDGGIDVSAIFNHGYQGNGGQVTVNSAYLYQNGTIFSNGVNGGMIQFNVGAATFTPNSRVAAMGFGGAGGQITVNSTGSVDIQQGAIMDTSGKVIGTYDTNIISIEGSLVNNQGILRANAIAGPDPRSADADSAIVQANPQISNLVLVSNNDGSQGGTIRLVANGGASGCENCAIENVSNPLLLNGDQPTFTSAEQAAIIQRNQMLVSNYNGDVVNSGTIQANGSDGSVSSDGTSASAGQAGGSVFIAAANDIINVNLIQANGGNGAYFTNGTDAGNGGTISLNAMNNINNTGTIEANGGQGGKAYGQYVWNDNQNPAVEGNDAQNTSTAGNGGNGGLIAFSYKTMTNDGIIRANGGQGGIGGEAKAYDSDVETAPQIGAFAGSEADGANGGQGGNGGLVVFSGPGNPTGSGLVQANGGQGGTGGDATAEADASATGAGSSSMAYAFAYAGNGGQGGQAGTVVAPDPTHFATSQNYEAMAGGQGDSGQASATANWSAGGTGGTDQSPFVPGSVTSGPNAPVQQTQTNELLSNNGDTLLLSQDNGNGTGVVNLSDQISNAIVRSVDNPLGWSTDKTALLSNTTNLVISNSNNSDVNFNLGSSVNNLIFNNLNTMTVLVHGAITNNDTWVVGIHNADLGLNNVSLSNAGGHVSWISSDDIINNGNIISVGKDSGGSVSLNAGDELTNNGFIANVAIDPNLLSAGANPSGLVSASGGSINLQAADNFTNYGNINNSQGFYSLLNVDQSAVWPSLLNNAQVGSTVNITAAHDLTNNGVISADALMYRDSTSLAQSPTNVMGGIINANAGNNLLNFGQITANGRSFSGNDTLPNITSSGLVEGNATGGYLNVHADNVLSNGLPSYNVNSYIEANGSSQGGQILLTAGGTDNGGLNAGIVNGTTFTNGFGTGTTTSGVNTAYGESFYNFGNVNAIHYMNTGDNGNIVYVANQQVALGQSGTTLGNVYMAAGTGAVKTITCNTPPANCPPPPPPPCSPPSPPPPPPCSPPPSPPPPPGPPPCPPPPPPPPPHSPPPPQKPPVIPPFFYNFFRTPPPVVQYANMIQAPPYIPPTAYLAQQAPPPQIPPETAIRKRLEKEIADLPNDQPSIPPPKNYTRRTPVRGFW